MANRMQWLQCTSSNALYSQTKEYLDKTKFECDAAKEQTDQKLDLSTILTASRYSIVSKLLCVTAYVLRFVNNLRSKRKQFGPQRASENNS